MATKPAWLIGKTMVFKTQLENINFEELTNETEFENCSTKSIFQDKLGFLWFATDKGLLKYDGINFKEIDIYHNLEKVSKDNNFLDLTCNNYRNINLITKIGNVVDFNINNELSTNLILPFHEFLKGQDSLNIRDDGNNNLWIGTMSNGLFRYNRLSKESSHFINNPSEPGNSISSNSISNLFYEINLNKIYIGTYGKGLNIFDCSREKFSCVVLDKTVNIQETHVGVNFTFRDSKNCLWVGTPSLLSRLNAQDELVDQINFYLEDFDNTNGNYLTCMCEDNDGMYWIGSPEGLICFNSNTGTYERFKFNESKSREMYSDYVTKLFKDQNNVIWIGTMGKGIFRFDRNEKKFLKINPRISQEEKITDNIYCLYSENKSDLWVGSYGDGAYRFRKKDNSDYEIKKFSTLKHVTVSGFTRDKKNNMWMGCNKYGLVYLDSYDKINVIDYHVLLDGLNSPLVYSFCQCQDKINPDLLWISVVMKKLVIFDMRNKVLVKNRLISDKFDNIPVHYLFFDSMNNLWIGTGGHGVYKYVQSEEKIYNYSIASGNLTTPITLIKEDENGNIWIGTQTDGLYKFCSEEKVFKIFQTRCIRISGLLFDKKGFLWISSDKNLYRINSQTQEYNCFYDLNDYNDYCYSKSEEGIFYFGGKKGVTYFRPEEIKTNTYNPNIVLTDFQIFYESVKPSPENPFLKQSISYTKEITLSYKESVITFEFAALIFNNPKMNQYAYKMEGFDDDWVYCGTRRTATYTNLDPGEYTFRVKGSNNDGLWNEEGTSINVIITPPWYKTVLFKGLVGLSVVGSIGSFYRKRIQKLNKEKTQQEEFTKKLIESQENERKRVAAELHDSLGQDLLIIKNKALVSIKKNEPEKLLEQMNEISELTSATLNDVREISYNLRPYELDRLGLTKTIESMIERANNSTNINFAANIDNIDIVFMPEVEINIYRIIQESLNNVIKHSQAREVIVSVLKKEKEIIINISDDGKGFDFRKYKMNSKRNGFGLKGIEERVKLMNGEFNIESHVGKGTVVKIQLTVDSW